MAKRNGPESEPRSGRYSRKRIEKGITKRVRVDGTGAPAFDVQVWANGSATSRTFRTLTDARRWRDKMLGDRATGRAVVPTDRRTKVSRFVERAWSPWLDEEVHLGNLRPSTAGWYRTGSKLLVAEIGVVRVVDVGKKTLRGMLSRRITHGDSQAKLRHLRATTRSVLALAVELDLLREDPSNFMVGRNAPKVVRPDEQAPKAWSQTDARHFLTAIEGDHLEALWVLLLGSGLRRGEALALRWSDLDPDTGLISVERSLTQVSGSPVLAEPKSRNSVRTIRVGSSVVEALGRHRRRQAKSRLSAGEWRNEDDLVFTKGDGSPLRPDYVTRRLKRLVSDTGLEWIRLHGLRHTMASLALQNGTDIATVSERLGHSDVGVTTRIYVHGSPESDRRAADVLDEVLHG